MTTLTIMKARIASELRRSDLTTQIAAAISTAIAAYEHERFLFSESREITFPTVAAQDFYDADDLAILGRILKLDYVMAEIGSTFYELDALSPADIERLDSSTTTNTGQPLGYTYYQQQLRLYPIPADAYTMRIGAQVRIAEPASDSETANPWMTTAERLIRSRAKYELYEHVLMDRIKAASFNPEKEAGPTYDAYRQLKRRTNTLTQQSDWAVCPTEF